MKKLLSLVLALAILASCVSMISIFAGESANVAVKLTANKDLSGLQYNRVKAGFTASDVVNGKITKTYKILNPNDHAIHVAVEYQDGWTTLTKMKGTEVNAKKTVNIPANSTAPFCVEIYVNDDNTVSYGANQTKAQLSNIYLRVDLASGSSMAAGESFYVLCDANDAAHGLATGGDAFTISSVTSVPAIATKAVVNGDAENGTKGWGTLNGGAIQNVADPDNANNKVMYFTPNGGKWATPAFNIGAAMINDAEYGYNGAGAVEYKLTFRAKAEAGKGGAFYFVYNSENHLDKAQIAAIVGEDKAKSPSYVTVSKKQIVLTDSWQTFEVNFTVSKDYLDTLKALYESSHEKSGASYNVMFRLDGSPLCYANNEFFNYYIDDIKIEKAQKDPAGVKFEITETIEKGYPIWRKDSVGFTQAMADANNNINLSYDIYNTNTSDLILEIWVQKGWNPTLINTKVTIPAGQKTNFAAVIKTDGNGNALKADGSVFAALSELSFRVDIRNESLKDAGTSFVMATTNTNDVVYNLANAMIMDGNNTGKTQKTVVTELPVAATPTPVADKTVVNGDVENGRNGWGAFSAGGGTLSVVEPGADGTGHAAKFGVTGKYDSIAFDLGPAIIQDADENYVGGGAGKYDVTFKAKAEAGKGGNFQFILNSQFHASANSNVVINGVQQQIPVNSYIPVGTQKFDMTDEWQTFTITVNVTEEFLETVKMLHDSNSASANMAYKLILRLDGSTGAFKNNEFFAYFLDDVSIVKQAAATATPTATATAAPTPTPTPQAPVGLKLETSEDLGTTLNYYFLSAEGLFEADANANGSRDVTYTIYNTSDKVVHIQYSVQCAINGAWVPISGAIINGEIAPNSSNTFTYTVENIVNGGVTKTYSGKTEIIPIEKLMVRVNFTFDDGNVVGNAIIVAAEDGDIIYKNHTSVRKITTAKVYTLPAGSATPTPTATATPTPTPVVTATPTPVVTPTPTPAGTAVGVKLEVTEEMAGYAYWRVDPAGVTQAMADADGNIIVKTDFYNTNDYEIILNAQFQKGWSTIKINGEAPDKSVVIPAQSKKTVTLTIPTDGNGNVVNSDGSVVCTLAQLSYRFQIQNNSNKQVGTTFYVAGNAFATKVGNAGYTSGGKATKTLVYELPELVEATPTPVPTPTPVVDKVVSNGDVENGLENWSDFAAVPGGTLEVVQPGADGTGNAIKFTATGKYQTVGFDLGPAIINDPAHGFNGGGAGTYVIGFWVKADANETSSSFVFALNSQAHYQKNAVVGTYTTTMNTYITTTSFKATTEWTYVEQTISITEAFLANLKGIYDAGKSNAYKLILRLDGSTGAFKDNQFFSYYVDDVTIERAKDPEGIIVTTNEVLTSDHYLITGSGVLAADPTFTGKKTITYTFYNTSDVNMNIALSMQAAHKTSTGSATWADVGKASSGVAAAGKKVTLTYTMDVVDGMVTITNGGVTTKYSLDKIFLRINVRTLGASEAGKTLVIAANSPDDMLYEITTAYKAKITPTADIPYEFEETTPADFAPKKENMNAENGLVNWGTIHGGKIELVQPGAAGTGNAVKFIASGKYNSVAFDLGPWIIYDAKNGYKGGGAGKYEVTFYAKAEKTGKFNVMLNSQLHMGKSAVAKEIGTSAAVGDTYLSGQTVELSKGWKKYTVTIDVKYEWYSMIQKLYRSKHANASLAYQLALRLDGATQAFKNSTFNYYIDQVSIKKVASYTNATPVGIELEVLQDHDASNYFKTNSGFVTKADVKDGTLTKTLKVKNTGTEDIRIQFELQAGVTSGGKAYWAAPATGEWFEIPAGEEVEITYECDVDDGMVEIMDQEIKIEALFARFNVRNADNGTEFVKGTKFQIFGTNTNEYKSLAKLTSSSAANWQITPIFDKSLKSETGDVLPVAMISAVAVAFVGMAVIVKAKKKED